MRRYHNSTVLAIALVLASACGTETTSPNLAAKAPVAGASANLLGLPLAATIQNLVAGQTWLIPVKQPIVVSTKVTPSSGGLLAIPTLGVVVVIPAGAVNAPTTITMTALPGSVVALDFQPAGTHFNVPLHVTQNMLFTHWLGAQFDVAYFKNTSDINNTNKTITVSEVIPVGLVGPIASFDIWHFSGYAAATGRSGGMRSSDE